MSAVPSVTYNYKIFASPLISFHFKLAPICPEFGAVFQFPKMIFRRGEKLEKRGVSLTRDKLSISIDPWIILFWDETVLLCFLVLHSFVKVIHIDCRIDQKCCRVQQHGAINSILVWHSVACPARPRAKASFVAVKM